VSFTLGPIASPTDFVTQFNKDIFNILVASAASSVDVSPRWSELGLNYPANTDTAVSSSVASSSVASSSVASSSVASPAWSEVGLTYQANLDASAAAVQHAFHPSENVLPPASPLLYHDVPAPPAGLLFEALLTVARNELHNVQHQSLNLLSDVAAHTAVFDQLVEELPFIKEIENILPPISAVLPARSPSPKYVVWSPTPPLRYPSPVAAPAVQPPAPINEVLNDFDLFPNLFACTNPSPTHPHLYTVLHEDGRKIWCPQDEFVRKDFLANIPWASTLDTANPNFVTPFRSRVYHEVLIKAVETLPLVTICAKVGLHPASLLFPFSYLESSFVDSIKFLFGQFPPVWLQYFNGSLVPLVSYDFLDGRLVTICRQLYFTEEGIFVIHRHTRIEDNLRNNPGLAQFTCSPRTPADLLLYLIPPPVEQPL